MIQSKSYFIPLEGTEDKIHIQRIFTKTSSKPMFCLHGSIENGRIFYSKEMDKGFAPYFAENGYDVFVADMRGKGKSTPKISKDSKYGMHDCILKTIPAIVSFLKNETANKSQTWVSHSWGGNLMNSFLVRFPDTIKVDRMIHFGVKRNITVRNLHRLYMLKFGWYFLGGRWLKKYGYLPFKEKNYGGDNEPKLFYDEINEWIKGEWIDFNGNFDYAENAKFTETPRSLWLAGKNDKVLGHPKDVKKTMNELANATNEFWLLAKANGFLYDYDHNNMLIHKDCANDVFPKILKWLEK